MQNLEIITSEDEKILTTLEEGMRQDRSVDEAVWGVVSKVIQLLWGSTVRCDRHMSLLEQGMNDIRYRDVLAGLDTPNEKVQEFLQYITPLYNQAIYAFKEELRQTQNHRQINPERLLYLKHVSTKLKKINAKLEELAKLANKTEAKTHHEQVGELRPATPLLQPPAFEKPKSPIEPPLAEPLSPSYLKSLQNPERERWVEDRARWLEGYVYRDLTDYYPDGKVFKRLADALRNRFKEHSIEEYTQLINILEKRFHEDSEDHEEIEWNDVEKALIADPEALWSLQQMEEEGYQPDIYMEDEDFYYFGHRAVPNLNVPYDSYGEGCLRGEGKRPSGNAVDFASIMGVELLTEEQGKKWALAFKKYKDLNRRLARILLKSENTTTIWCIKNIWYNDYDGELGVNTFRSCVESTALAFSLKVRKIKS